MGIGHPYPSPDGDAARTGSASQYDFAQGKWAWGIGHGAWGKNCPHFAHSPHSPHSAPPPPAPNPYLFTANRTPPGGANTIPRRTGLRGTLSSNSSE